MWRNIEFITEIIKNSLNKTDVLLNLGLKNNGGNYNSLSSFIIENNTDISHFVFKKQIKKRVMDDYESIDDILVKNSKFKSTTHLKNKLYKFELKKRECEICGQGEEWNGKKMSLILDHINGDRHDNSIDNLRIVCPNCNATFETHCRGLNISKGVHDKCLCGGFKKRKSKICINCISKKVNNVERELKVRKIKRKVQRPPYEQLLLEVGEIGYVATGKKYGVSDNSIRKWIRMYKKYGENF
jgi:hypothetical protein